MITHKPKVRQKTILLVDDEAGYGDAMAQLAARHGIHLDSIHSKDLNRVISGIESYDVLMLSYDLDSYTGLELAEFFGRTIPKKPLVMVSQTSQLWVDDQKAIPSVKAVVSKWDGMGPAIAKALAV